MFFLTKKNINACDSNTGRLFDNNYQKGNSN